MSAFSFDQKTPEEVNAYLDEEVAAGRMTEAEADTWFNAFLKMQEGSSLQNIVKKPVADLAINIQDSPFFNAAKIQHAENIAAGGKDTEETFLQSLNKIAQTNLSGLSDEKLAAIPTLLSNQEQNVREEIREQSFLERLSNPEYLNRLGGQGLKSIPQTANALVGLGPLIGMGIEKLSGFDLGAKQNMQLIQNNQRDINQFFGVSDPVAVEESIMENITGAAVPGGLGMKALGVATDFGVDQTIRELTDDVGEKYETVFDKIGLTNNNAKPTMNGIAALGVGILAGSVSAKAIDVMTKKAVKVPTLVDVRDIDPNAPKGLQTLEKASDLTTMNVLDEQQALKNIIKRAGVPDYDDLAARIEFDTHTSIRTRAQEALNTGKLTANGAKFDAPVAPKTLYNAYNALSPDKRKNVRDYLNLRDMRDDVAIAIANGKATQTDLTKLDQQIAGLERLDPMVKQFGDDYRSITSALRDFAEGSLFSPKFRTKLDQERPNYVPLEISNVDPDAPFLQRLKQAQTEGVTGDTDWFLKKRESIGQYDLNRRADPMDMLMQAAEATIISRTKNDTKLAIIDNLLNSSYGDKTIRRVKGDDLSRYPDRIVSVYRNGKKENYVTTKLQAQLLQFDPYVAKHPMLFAPKRVFEQAAVGPLSITFAPVTALRDAIGGRVTRPDGLLAPSVLETAAAIPEQLFAKAQNSLAQHIEAGLKSGNLAIPEGIMDAAQQKKFANNLANSYVNTVYHRANEAGGFDASLMKNKIELGQGMLAEVKRAIRENGQSFANIPGAKFSADRISNMIDGFNAVFSAIQEAPRFAAIKKTVEAGEEVAEATKKARQLTGDVTKSGRVYTPEGKRIDVDAVDQGLLNVANKPIGMATEFLRESTPFFNPMIQGNRRLLQSIVDDPVGFNMRAWMNIGLPALAIYGWNEMLGQEYNDYAMNERSGRDVVMNTYLGIPGRPPEEGIEIPMMHELLAFNAPFTRSLYGISRGERSEETRLAMALVAENILSNSLDVGFPVAGQAAANVAGYSAPESLLRPTEGVYKIREDNVGVLPENYERLARTLFAGVGDTAINVANALEGEHSFEVFYKTLGQNVLETAPIAKNLAGTKKINNYFSIPNDMAKTKFNAIEEFRDYYDSFYNPKRLNDDGLEKPSSKNYYTSKNYQGAEQEDLPYLMVGPETKTEPTNPLYPIVGDLLVENVQRSGIGMSAVVDRERTYAKYASRLRDFNNGQKEALREWQAMLNGLTDAGEDTKRLQNIVSENGFDLTKYEDRVKLINLIEKERSEMIQMQLDLFEQTEDQVTALLHEKGMLPPDKKFLITEHLNPYDENPFD